MVYQDRLETCLSLLIAHPDTSEWLSIISVMNFEVNNVAEQKLALLATIFLFFKVFILFNSFTSLLTYRCFGVPGKEGKIIRCVSLLYTWGQCESRTVVRKSSIGGLCVCAGGFYVCARGAWHTNLIKIPLIYSISCFNLGGLGALFEGAKSTKAPSGDGSVWKWRF